MNNGTTPTGCTLGLIGRPLGHSYSKVFFDTLFERENRSESYGLFELPELTPATLYTLLLMNPCLRGFNVTAPYKEAIVPMLDSMDSVAQAVGAVNTVSVRRADDGRVLALDGYNTDVAGFTGAIAPVLGEARPGALILGTGGASNRFPEGVAYAVRQQYKLFRYRCRLVGALSSGCQCHPRRHLALCRYRTAIPCASARAGQYLLRYGI